ncbi:MAG TPA: hypothetical protein VMT87_15580, partial [Vicinamibacteria bacterium]|nr:hypothetical protein [Vicinamibacteria bacterium]
AGLAVALLAPLALRRAPPPSAREAVSRPAAPLSTSSPGPREREPFPQAAPAPAAPAVGARAAQDLSAEGTARRERSAADAEGRAEPKGRREEVRPGPAGTPSAGRFGEAAPAPARAAGGADRSLPEARRQVASGQEWPPTPGTEVAEAEEEEDAPALVSDASAPPRRAAKSVTAAPVPRAGVAPPPAGVDARLRSLSSRTMRSAAEARELRDAWEAFVREDPEGPHADDARLRALEAGAAAWGLGGQRDDRARVEKDAREYLRRAQGAHKERVRALLAGLQP